MYIWTEFSNFIYYMRKILFIFLFLSAITVHAQSFHAGMQLGMTGTQVTGDQLSGFHKAGIFGGVFVNHRMGKLGDFQMELNFIQKGSRKNARPDQGDYLQYLMRLNYVALPVMYKFKIKDPLTIEVGVEFAYLINSKEFDGTSEIDPYYAKDFRDFDFSGFAGLGIDFWTNFRFVFRYSYSIIPITFPPSSNSYTFYTSGHYNEVLIASIQYNF